MMKKLQKNKAFTLVETLVAISILMIAVAGPLTVANQGLTSAIYSKDQMVASFLVQESMETIKYLRDYNLSSGAVNWLENIYCGNTCDISGFSFMNGDGYLNYYRDCVGGSENRCRLYLNNINAYTHDSSGKPTHFYRNYKIVQAGNPATACGTADTECVLTVTVSWKEGTIPFSISLSSAITQHEI